MHRRPLLIGPIVVVSLLLLAACGDDSGSIGETAAMGAASSQDLQAQRWLLDEAAGNPSFDADGSVTIDFDEDAVHGTGPCNTFNGAYELDGDSIAIGPLASTMRSCGDMVDQAETAIFAAFEAVDTAAMDDDRLVLSGPDDLEMVFIALDVDDVLAATWSIVSVNTGDAIQSVINESDPELTLEADGTASITTGCNNGATTWERDGDDLTFGVVAGTLMACEDDLMEQEQAIFSALEATTSFEVTPGQLTLLDDEGRMVLIAIPADS